MLMLPFIFIITAVTLGFFCKDRITGIATSALGTIAVLTGVTLLLQVFGVFTRTALVGTVIGILCIAWFIIVRYRSQMNVLPMRSWQRIAAIVLAIGIVGYQFYAVHFSYTGIANTILGETYVTESAYPYPLFSDEWIAVAVADTAIETQSLPFTHPFTGAPYQNFLFTFHSFIAGVGLLLGGSLATVYVWLGILVSTVTVALFFVFWRTVGVSFGLSILGVLLVPYVVGGSNLPMLWYLLPWNMGFLLMLVAFILFAKKQLHVALVALGVSVAMYPPFIVLAIPILVGATRGYVVSIQKRIWLTLGLFTIVAPLAFIVATTLVADVPFATAASRFFEILIRPLNSAFGTVPTFLPWHVLPYLVVPFAVYGCWIADRTLRCVVFPTIFGALVWAVNPLTDTTFFIDYHRVVAVTALLALLLSVVGMQRAWDTVQRRYVSLRHAAIPPVFVASVLIIFLVLTPSYTNRDGWRNFTSTYYDSLRGFVTEQAPAPVNRYVQPDDLRIFSMISGERFLAPGWKGLVLGTLTNNDPVFTKPSTITMKTVRYTAFLQASCEEKIEMLSAAQVRYVYAEKVNCPGFESLAVSGEGLHLLRVAVR